MSVARFCSRCGCVVTVGYHRANGDFDPQSVPVSDEEIAVCVEGRRRSSGHNHVGPRTEERVRFNISFGRHLGVRT